MSGTVTDGVTGHCLGRRELVQWISYRESLSLVTERETYCGCVEQLERTVVTCHWWGSRESKPG